MQKTLKKYFPLFVLPTLAAFVISFLAPFFMGIYLSFTEFKVVNESEWVGFKNYIRIFTSDETFLNSLWLTVKFTFVSVITVNVIAFAVALLMTRGLRGTNAFRTVFFMPNLIGGIVRKDVVADQRTECISGSAVCSDADYDYILAITFHIMD